MSQKPPKDIAGFIFDVDGCVARGTRALPGVPDTLAHLRARGIRCAFMTNENMSTRSQVVAKLVAMGIPCTAEDVVTAAMVAAEVTRALHPGKKVLAVGAAGLVTGLPPKGGSLPLKLDSPIEGSSSLSIIVTPSGIEPSEVNFLPLPAKAGSPTEVSLWKPSTSAGWTWWTRTMRRRPKWW